MEQRAPVIDQHAHRVLRDAAVLPAASYRAAFSESRDPAMLAGHTPRSLVYRQALRLLADLFGCEPSEGGVLEARAALGTPRLVRRLFEDAAITTVLIDTGYERGEALSEDELAAAGGVTVRRVCRIESLAESLIAGTTRFDDFTDRLWAALARLRDDGYVAVKSIIAYRDGLAVDGPPPVHEAEADWAALRRASSSREEGRRVRLDRPALLRYVLFLALEACRAQRLAIQFHAGLGDSDLDLTRANPACLRALLEDERYRDVPIVLLHNYPYLREASYLAHLYRNVYVDASLAIPLVGRAARTILEELFELAPTSKILYASDGHTVPDLFWLGAHYATRAIRAMAETWVAEGVCSAGDAERIAADFLGGNARAVYGL